MTYTILMIFKLQKIHVFLVKNDTWKSSVIYFMQICNTGVLLLSSGKIL